MALVGVWLLAGGLFGLGLVFVGYPLWMRLLGAMRREGSDAVLAPPTSARRASVLVAMRNAEALLPAKLENLAGLEAPHTEIEVWLASDGSTDQTVPLARAAAQHRPNWHVIELKEHGGKHEALHAAASQAQGDLLVFTDVDALLAPSALGALLAPFGDPAIGGVCGQRQVGEGAAFHADAQDRYVQLDSGLKSIESRVGSITSNDGKLYAIRRSLYQRIPGGVTDDLFSNMSVVRQGARFVFAPGARAWIRTPSRHAQHELSRRRRIVCRSLRGIWSQRVLLNPLRTGWYGLGLLINKVGRRLLPFFLLAVVVGTGLLAFSQPWARWVFAAQIIGVLVVAGEPSLRSLWKRIPFLRPIGRGLQVLHYAGIGLLGTFLGVLDFVRAREVTRWDPLKTDG